jgi:hypothetical protein
VAAFACIALVPSIGRAADFKTKIYSCTGGIGPISIYRIGPRTFAEWDAVQGRWGGELRDGPGVKVVANRRLLRDVMTRAGFQQLPEEWWHFDALPADQVKLRYAIIE